MRWVRRILFIGLVGAFFYGAVRFSSENEQLVVVHYLAGATEQIELWHALALAAGVGAISSALPLAYLWTRSRLLVWQYRRTMNRQETEIHQLRNLPLTTPQGGEPEPDSVAVSPAASRDTVGSGA